MSGSPPFTSALRIAWPGIAIPLPRVRGTGIRAWQRLASPSARLKTSELF
jgi:hypothetical protein